MFINNCHSRIRNKYLWQHLQALYLAQTAPFYAGRSVSGMSQILNISRPSEHLIHSNDYTLWYKIMSEIIQSCQVNICGFLFCILQHMQTTCVIQTPDHQTHCHLLITHIVTNCIWSKHKHFGNYLYNSQDTDCCDNHTDLVITHTEDFTIPAPTMHFADADKLAQTHGSVCESERSDYIRARDSAVG